MTRSKSFPQIVSLKAKYGLIGISSEEFDVIVGERFSVVRQHFLDLNSRFCVGLIQQNTKKSILRRNDRKPN